MKSIRRFPGRAVLPAAVAVIAALASLIFLGLPNPDPGIHLGYQDGEVVIASVDYGSAAAPEVRAGEVVTWLNDRYVLGESDQAKRDIAQSSGPWTQLTVTSREGAKADEAVFPKLVEAARRSDIPWLSDPEHNPVPACYLDGTCAQYLVHLQPDGSSYTSLDYWFSFDNGEICVLAGGNGLFPVSTGTLTGPAGTTPQAYPGLADGSLCVATSSVSLGASTYGYVGPMDEGFFREMWMPISTSPGPTVLGWMILLIGWFVVGRGWAGSALKPYALTLPLATAVPLLVLPIDRYPFVAATVVGSVLLPLGMLPLAIDFLGRVEGRRRRGLVASVAVGLSLAAIGLGLLIPAHPGLLAPRAFVASCVAFVPGVFAARPLRPSDQSPGAGWLGWRALLARLAILFPGRFALMLRRRLESTSAAGSAQTPRAFIESVDVLLAAMTPGVAAICLTSAYTVDYWPLLWWLGALLIATRLIVRPLGRLATVARLQRDLVVAATEAERTRIAADIHDDALQDLTMLVRRLDAAGDTENAQAAREIAERLRAICGDLKLPVLDDLGVGPALEWLCERMAARTEPITLDRLSGESRLPADVELAVFRVAQEALSNAVLHGSPPIVVRYRAREGWVELEVDDSGAGIAEGAAEQAEQTGHLGLLNMTQRAEAVGARLSIRRRPGGGTRVSFIWERATAPAAALIPAPA